MSQVIMIGCDLHDGSMLLKIAEGRQTPDTRSFQNTTRGRAEMIAGLKRRAKAAGTERIVLVYEASGQGFGLYDQLVAAGIECHVLAPTRIAHSPQQRKRKTDEQDALALLELLRAHVLAGNALPAVWIPGPQTRDDREVVRQRLDVAEKLTATKTQIQSLLKRSQVARPAGLGKRWTKTYRAWLAHSLAEPLDATRSPLGSGARTALGSLLRQMKMLEEEVERLDKQLPNMAWSPRYEAAMRALTGMPGVGVLTALVFLTELGDLRRFANRRQLAAYLGVVPSSHESGKSGDRKGHITHQGSPRVRKMLCQATWVRLRHDPEEKAAYERIRARNPKHKKIAVVASMRRLAICLWHRGVAAAERTAADSPATVRAAPQVLPARSTTASPSDFRRHDKGVRGRREREVVPGMAVAVPGT